MKKAVFMLLFFVMLFCNYLTAQTLEESIEILSGDAAKAYVNPIVSAFGANINGGWFHQAPKARFLDWDLEISAIMMVSPFNSSDDTFTQSGRFRFTNDQARTLTADLEDDLSPSQYDALLNSITSQYFPVNIYGPTIVGKSYNSDDPGNTGIHIGFPSTDVHYSVEGVPGEQVVTVNNQDIVLPVGGLLEKYPALPLTTPQLTIGTLAGTKMSIRYLPEIKMVDNLGSLKYFGVGIQHNPGVWFPIPIPVDFALSFTTQSLQIGNFASASATNYGVNVSKTFGLV